MNAIVFDPALLTTRVLEALRSRGWRVLLVDVAIEELRSAGPSPALERVEDALRDGSVGVAVSGLEAGALRSMGLEPVPTALQKLLVGLSPEERAILLVDHHWMAHTTCVLPENVPLWLSSQIC
jgi:hypothetical protein